MDYLTDMVILNDEDICFQLNIKRIIKNIYLLKLFIYF